MKKLFEAWCGISLVKRIVAGLIIGAILGIALPQFSAIAILGSVFVGALKAVAPLLVFSWSSVPCATPVRATAALSAP